MAKLPTLFTGAQRGAAMPFQSDRAGAAFSSVGRAIGQGLQSIGGDLERAGSRVARYAHEQNTLLNENAARDANTQARIKAMELYDNYSKLQGQNAVNAFPQFITDLEAIKTDTLANLQTEDAKRMAAASIDSWSLGYRSGAMGHRSNEEIKWTGESFEAASQQSIADANLYRNNPAMVHDFIEDGARDVFSNAIEVLGLDESAATVRAQKYRGEAYRTVIANLASEDPIAAQAVFDTVRDTLDPESQAVIADALKPKVLNARADGIITAITTGAPSEEAATAVQFFINRGYTPAQAAGVVGNLMHESGLNPTASGDSGSAFGIAQWRGDRLRGLEEFAQKNGLTPNTLLTQLMYVDYELRNNESGAGAKLGAAGSVDEAAAAFLDFERPQGWTSGGDPALSHGWSNRLAQSQALGGGGDFDPTKPPDQNAMLAKGLALAGDDADLQRLVVSRVNEYVNMYEARTAQARAALAQNVKNVAAALEAGDTTVTIPEADIRSLLPESEADQVVAGLKMAQIGGTMFNSIEFASPQAINQQRADFEAGNSTYSEMVKDILGVDESTPQGQAAVAANTTALRAEFEKAVKRRNDAIASDSAAYVLTEPSVAGARQVLDQNPTPEAWSAYVTNTLAQQERLGVLQGDQHVLTKTEAKTWVDRINENGPKAASDTLASLEQQMGENWPRIFGELVEAGLPGPYIAYGVMNDPVARVTLSNVLMAEQDKEGIVRSSLDKEVAGTIDERASDEMSDFLATFTYVENGVQIGTSLVEAVRLTAYGLTPQMGAEAAVKRAAASVLGSFDISMDGKTFVARSPRGLGARMEMISLDVRNKLQAEDLLMRTDPTGVYPPDDIANATVQAARHGTWITSPDGMGWTLVAQTLGGGFDPVLRADGSYVTLSYEDAAKIDPPSVVDYSKERAYRDLMNH